MIQCHYCKKPTNNPKYCSRHCAAIVNNTKYQKLPKKIRKCKHCGQFIGIGYKGAYTCTDCNPNIVNWSSVTLGDCSKKFPNIFQKHARIRSMSRRIYNNSGLPKQCYICGYNRHYQVCHKKPISAFNDDNTIAEVNDISNLIALCPNHHWELDHGFLTLN